jgi:hypothetical protein
MNKRRDAGLESKFDNIRIFTFWDLDRFDIHLGPGSLAPRPLTELSMTPSIQGCKRRLLSHQSRNDFPMCAGAGEPLNVEMLDHKGVTHVPLKTLCRPNASS